MDIVSKHIICNSMHLGKMFCIAVLFVLLFCPNEKKLEFSAQDIKCTA
jgi:hypothetical protein